jgi:valyl-tRNA synthetase
MGGDSINFKSPEIIDKEIMKEFNEPYNPQKTEEKIYHLWEKSGFFNPDNLPDQKTKPYVIMIAPPNITGSLHMGHALENTISDILIRFHRMRGRKTLWLPGTDHAGIATQNVVEKELKKQGLTRHDLGKEKFLEKIWEWKEKYGNIILEQLKKLGCSLDWSRTKFTMDSDYQEAVKTAFEHYHKKGLIYQGDRVINWCIKDQTALSDLELEYAEETSKLWHIKYPIKNSREFIIVATTRPETMLGDTAVAVNPKDARYEKLVGKTAILPLTDREIPIVADPAVDMEFGTGAVKVTPAHDLADSEIAEKNKLPYIKIIDETGKITNVNEEFDGLKIAQAREKVLQKLKKLNLIEKEEDFAHNIAKCYRCNSTIEPLLSKQWFLKMKPLAEKTIEAIKRGDVKYFPARWEKIALDWLDNVRDWCVSRQIWWGHSVPVWYKTHTGTEMEAVHFDEKILCKKLGLKDEAEFDRFSDNFLQPDFKNRNIQWASNRDGIIQLYIGYVNFLKEKGYVDDNWIKKNRIKRRTIKSDIFVGEKPPEPIGWIQDTDTFDTWFSSALWPFATLGWPKKTKDLEKFYPTTAITSARDILHLWIARMIFSGLEFMGQVPFKDVVVHATILTKEGKRMSKSLGTGIDPLELIEKYGADATRFGLIYQAFGGQDIRFNENVLMMGKKFANKLWNIARFTLTKTDGKINAGKIKLPAKIDQQSKALLDKLNKTAKEVAENIQNYNFGEAAHVVYDFVWRDFADKYIEYSKTNDTEEVKIVLSYTLVNILKLLHPFMPFITERIWQEMIGAKLIDKKSHSQLLMIEKWPG